MLTLEQIKNVTFTRSMGGYKMSEVDDFLDQCADTVDSLIKERNASNKKLEVLADKLMEYRNDEDSIRSALVNAQRLGDTIVREANQKAALAQEDAAIKAEKLVEDARAKAKEAINSVADDIRAQQEELARAKHEVALFKEQMLALYKEHLSLLGMLPEEPADESKPAEKQATDAVADTVKEPVAAAPVNTVNTASKSEPVNEVKAEAAVADKPASSSVSAAPAPVVPAKPATEEASAVAASAPVQVPLVVSEPPKAEEPSAPKSRFGDLKFGDDYVISEDHDDASSTGKGFFKRKK